jgi:hypothetical protein
MSFVGRGFSRDMEALRKSGLQPLAAFRVYVAVNS